MRGALVCDFLLEGGEKPRGGSVGVRWGRVFTASESL